MAAPADRDAMNIVYFSAHSILEYDDVRMFTEMGHDVFSIGAYEDPARPGDDNGDLKRPPKRPAIPGAKAHPELSALCHEVRHRHGAEGLDFMIDWAKADLHPEVIEWADVIICPFFPEAWLAYQWDRIKHKRVIWRTCGQSNPQTEMAMRMLHRQGLEIVRYSPKERSYFESIGTFAGEDALIRFGKYPADYGPWTGEDAAIANVTQDMANRGEACGLSFYLAATAGLPAKPAGPNSEALPGGVGALGYDAMLDYLRKARAYLYTGTNPASYTLGLIEAMLSGVPVVAMGANAFAAPGLYEADELTRFAADKPSLAGNMCRSLLYDLACARDIGASQRKRAVELFGAETITAQWADHLAGVLVAA